MILLIVVYIIALGIYCISPLVIQVILFIANCYISDPIPFIDEFIMVASIIRKFYQISRIVNFIKDHPVVACAVVVAVVGVLIWIF